MIIAVVFDTSASAAARSASGLSTLDAAKSAAEHFYKCRSRDLANAQMQLQFQHHQQHHYHHHPLLPLPQADTFILATADASAPIKAIDRGSTVSVHGAFPGQQQQQSRQIQQHRKWHAALKAASAGDASAIGVSVRASLDVISLIRQGSGADTHGCGWTPAAAQPWCVVVLTDGGSWSWPDGSLATASSVARGCVASFLAASTSSISSSSNSTPPPLPLPSAASLAPLVGLHLLPSSAPPSCGELTASPFRWDGRVCGAVLRLPGVVEEEEANGNGERKKKRNKKKKKREINRNPYFVSVLDAASALCGESEEEKEKLLISEEAPKHLAGGVGNNSFLQLQQQQQRQKLLQEKQQRQRQQQELLRERRRFPFRKPPSTSRTSPFQSSSPALVGAELACVCEASGGKAVEARSLRALLSWVEQLSASLVVANAAPGASFSSNAPSFSSSATSSSNSSTAPLRLVVNLEPTPDAFASRKEEALRASATGNTDKEAEENEDREQQELRRIREEEEEERAACSARTISFLGSSPSSFAFDSQQQQHSAPGTAENSSSSNAPLWPVPEAFSAAALPLNAPLPPRAAFPTLKYFEPKSSNALNPGTAAWPTPPPGFPLDTYEVEGGGGGGGGSPLPARVVAGLKAAAAASAAASAVPQQQQQQQQQQQLQQPLAGWPVYVANSLGDGGGLGDACGLLHVSPPSATPAAAAAANIDESPLSSSPTTKVFLTLLPYNYPMLFRLLDALAAYPGGARLAPPPAWRAEFARYLRAAPAPAVAAPLRAALARLGLPVHLVPELRDGGLPPNVGAFLRRVQAGARGEVERAEANASAAAAAAAALAAASSASAAGGTTPVPRITVDPSAVPGPGALLSQLASLARGASSAIWESAAGNEERRRKEEEEEERGGGNGLATVDDDRGKRRRRRRPPPPPPLLLHHHHRHHHHRKHSHFSSSSWGDHSPGGKFAVPVSEMGDYVAAAAAASPSRAGAAAAAPLRDASAAAAAAAAGEAEGRPPGGAPVPFGNPFAADAARRGARRSRSRSRSVSPAPQQREQQQQQGHGQQPPLPPFAAADEAAGEAAAAFGGDRGGGTGQKRSPTPPPPKEGDAASSAASPASTLTAAKPIPAQQPVSFFFFPLSPLADEKNELTFFFPFFPPSNENSQAAHPDDAERADAMWAEMLAARRSSAPGGAAAATSGATMDAAATTEEAQKKPQRPRGLPRPLRTPAEIDRLVGVLSLFSEAAAERREATRSAAEEELVAALRGGGGGEEEGKSSRKRKKSEASSSSSSAQPFPGNARVWASALAQRASKSSSSSSLARALRKVAAAAAGTKETSDDSDDVQEAVEEEEEEEKGNGRKSKRARHTEGVNKCKTTFL